MKKLCAIVLLLACMSVSERVHAQNATIKGNIKNSSTKEPLKGVSIVIAGTSEGVVTDDLGNFVITTSKKFPISIELSFVGFEKQQLQVRADHDRLIVELDPLFVPGQEVVVSPTRVRTKILETPVSAEWLGPKQLANSASGSYYDMVGTLKGVDLTSSSLLFKTISTRGFNGSGSTRVNQQVDGMDNQAPGLNFFVGNFVGLAETDVDHIEILPGASSALYGPGGMNGTVLISSKDPFRYTGLSVQAKQGIMNVDKHQRPNATPFYDYSFRWAAAFKEKLAVKIGAEYVNATDWLASDSNNYLRTGSTGRLIAGSRMTDPNYDGVNVYGDETSRDLRHLKVGNQVIDLWSMVGQGIKQMYPQLGPGIDAALALSPSVLSVSRTGYAEKDVIDPQTKNIKLSGAFHYRFNENLEAQLMGYWATGNTVYTGNNRYSFKGIKLGQYKAELKSRNWFLRTYTTQENAGQAHSATVTTQIFNEAWKPSGQWFQEYAQGYLAPAATLWSITYQDGLGHGLSQGDAAARANDTLKAKAIGFYNSGRSAADQGRPLAGSPQFKHLFDSVRMVPIPNGGLFLEKSQLWMTEGQYNFSKLVKFADIIVGGDVKKYILNSKGTLFIDTIKPIAINEFGAYGQVTKKLFKDFLSLSVSGRYDKNEDFKGHFTPRATALLRVARDNNIRLSYQTAYRFPSTQQKYIRLNVGDYILLGGLPWVMDYMNVKANPVVDATTGATYQYKELKPESSRSFEVGYKGLIKNRLLIDAYAYWGKYTDFLGRNVLYQPATGQTFSTVINNSTKVNTHGFGLGIDYLLPYNYSLFANLYSDVITHVPTGFQSFFNTPKYRLNAGIANTGLGSAKRIGFNVNLRWQDAFMWDGELANGPIDGFLTADAQLSYKFPKIKSMIKLGGTNIMNKYYKNAYANPEVGGLYYLSIAYNIL